MGSRVVPQDCGLDWRWRAGKRQQDRVVGSKRSGAGNLSRVARGCLCLCLAPVRGKAVYSTTTRPEKLNSVPIKS
jgi:hypothetical protein